MSSGITKSVATLGDLAQLTCDVLGVVKGGLGLGSFSKILGLLGDIQRLAGEAPAALPELLDLDTAEAAQLGGAAYDAVKKVLAALAA